MPRRYTEQRKLYLDLLLLPHVVHRLRCLPTSDPIQQMQHRHQDLETLEAPVLMTTTEAVLGQVALLPRPHLLHLVVVVEEEDEDLLLSMDLRGTYCHHLFKMTSSTAAGKFPKEALDHRLQATVLELKDQRFRPGPRADRSTSLCKILCQ